eukprot:2716856-Pleurochrysis_carterae.AAC.1
MRMYGTGVRVYTCACVRACTQVRARTHAPRAEVRAQSTIRSSHCDVSKPQPSKKESCSAG